MLVKDSKVKSSQSQMYGNEKAQVNTQLFIANFVCNIFLQTNKKINGCCKQIFELFRMYLENQKRLQWQQSNESISNVGGFTGLLLFLELNYISKHITFILVSNSVLSLTYYWDPLLSTFGYPLTTKMQYVVNP